jgi:hypothetical protein
MDTKRCILRGCTGTMRRTHVHLSEDVLEDCDALVGDADVTADYEAWVCRACGLQQRCSSQGLVESTVADGKSATRNSRM